MAATRPDDESGVGHSCPLPSPFADGSATAAKPTCRSLVANSARFSRNWAIAQPQSHAFASMYRRMSRFFTSSTSAKLNPSVSFTAAPTSIPARISASGELVPRLQRMSSTTFDAQLKVASLVARDNPHLYFDIQTLNDYGADSLQALRAATERIERLVQSRDEAGFVELMAAGRRYLEKQT